MLWTVCLRITILLVCGSSLFAQVARQFHVEYRKQASGIYAARLINSYKAPVTAYIAQATYRLEGKQQPAAWGGDSYSYPDGGTEIPPGFEAESNSLPPGAEPLTSGVIAVIYADGFAEGDEAVVQMMLAGRRRTLIDLKKVLAEIDKLNDVTAVAKVAAALKAADLAEAAQLDDMITVPGVKHQYFMTAVPAWLGRDKMPSAATYSRWLKNIIDSKPAL